VDPTARGLGFVVLEGPARLIDWGTKAVRRSDKNRRCTRAVLDLIRWYEPDVLVVEDCRTRGSRRCPRVRTLLGGLDLPAKTRDVRVCKIAPRAARVACTASADATKHQVATTLATTFPELALRLPPPRKPWMSEDARMSIFDALALAVTFYGGAGRRGPPTVTGSEAFGNHDKAEQRTHLGN
jgi:Holliday junction resolvasome RuvABC endonuclease subunit